MLTDVSSSSPANGSAVAQGLFPRYRDVLAKDQLETVPEIHLLGSSGLMFGCRATWPGIFVLLQLSSENGGASARFQDGTGEGPEPYFENHCFRVTGICQG